MSLLPYYLRRRAAHGPVYRYRFGGSDYTDSAGHVWTGYTAGDSSNYFDYSAGGYATPSEIANTSDGELYVAVRFGHTPFTLPVPAGNYALIAHYCEDFLDVASRICGLRDSTGGVLIPDFSVYTAAGGRKIAYRVAATVAAVATSSGLTLSNPNTGTDEILCALELTKLS